MGRKPKMNYQIGKRLILRTNIGRTEVSVSLIHLMRKYRRILDK